ncbi:MAG: FHA domain-containing protein [Candidatus Bruticola sp.]
MKQEFYERRKGKVLALRRLLLLISAVIIAAGLTIVGPGQTASAQGSSNNSLILIQSEIAGTQVFGSGVIVLTGRDACQAVTSYEAIKGAARITALAAGYSPVPAKLLRFAPEANIALLEIPIPNLPAAKIGDSDVVKGDTPIAINYTTPITSDDMASSFEIGKSGGNVIDTISRPGGTVMRLQMATVLRDETSGAPVYLPNTNELIAVSLSLEASSGRHDMRFAIPISMAGALSPNIKTSPDSIANIRVLDGEDAPILEGSPEVGEQAESGAAVPIIVGAVVVVILGGAAYFILGRKKGKSIEPFSVLPLLPENMPMAFVTADGKLLEFTEDTVTIGRAQSNSWCFSESSVSGRHARIRKSRDGSSYELEDLGSSYGTFIRGRRVGRKDVIHPGDIIRFGDVTQIKLLTRAESQAKNAIKSTQGD